MTDPNQLRAPDQTFAPSLEEYERWGKNIVRYEIKLGAVDAGKLEVNYSFNRGEVYIDAVHLKPEFQGQGYGKAVYEQVTELPLPNGSRFAESGMKFVSSDQLSESAKRVWESFVKDGKAVKLDDGSYEMLPKAEI